MREEILRSLSFLKIDKKKLNELLEVPKNPEMGDYALPCFILAKEMKKSPNEIAKEIATKIKPDKNIEKAEAAGPYVNFFINKIKLAGEIIDRVSKEKDKYGSGKINEKTVIEICSPNSNKPLHLGHARNIVFGQSVANICKFMGNDLEIVSVNNDRGVHICKSMIAYEKFGNGMTPEKANKKSDHFVGDYYVKFAQAAKEDNDLEKEAQECLQKWEKGDKETIELWKKINKWAFDGFAETYKLFGLDFDKEYFESEIYEKGKKIVNDALKKGLVKKEKDGSVYIDLKKEGLGKKTLLRKDGTSIYITQDLYLAVNRYEDFKFDKMIYVVASEQDYHFKVLFSILEKLGYKWADRLHHLNYGLVHLESGRMKSREGTVVDIDNLIKDLKDIAIKEIENRYPDIFADEAQERALAISLAALRYYFLKIDRVKETTFKPEESLRFEGDTGPYLLYSYARAKSILRKANYKKEKKFTIEKPENNEKSLITEIANFPEIVQQAYRNLAPNTIANYSYELAKKFNEFYHNIPVVGSEQEQFRLKLVDAFSQTLKNSLNLLGINVIEEM